MQQRGVFATLSTALGRLAALQVFSETGPFMIFLLPPVVAQDKDSTKSASGWTKDSSSGTTGTKDSASGYSNWSLDANGNWVDSASGQVWCTDTSGAWISTGCPIGSGATSAEKADAKAAIKEDSKASSSASTTGGAQAKDDSKTGGVAAPTSPATPTPTPSTSSPSPTQSTSGSPTPMPAPAADARARPAPDAVCNDATALASFPAVRRCITHQGRPRCWYTYDPGRAASASSAGGGGNLPALVLDLHGFGDCASSHARMSGWKAEADRKAAQRGERNLMVVYPQAAAVDGYPTWAADGTSGAVPGSSYSKTAHIDDLGFLRKLLNVVKGPSTSTASSAGGATSSGTSVGGGSSFDPGRIYVAGYSNGCMMAQRFALETSALVAAVGCASANLLNPPETRPWYFTNPVAFLQVHGNADRVGATPFDVGNARRWALYNGCDVESGPTVVARSAGRLSYKVHTWGDCDFQHRVLGQGRGRNRKRGLSSRSFAGGRRATSSTSSTNGGGNVEVRLIELEGVGHDTYNLPGGLDTTQLISGFVQQYERPGVSANAITTSALQSSESRTSSSYGPRASGEMNSSASCGRRGSCRGGWRSSSSFASSPSGAGAGYIFFMLVVTGATACALY